MKRKLFGPAALGGNHKDVIVAVAIGGESNPLAVGRKPRIDVARAVHSQTLDIAAVLIRYPDITQVAERDFAIVITGMAQQLDFSRAPSCKEHQKRKDELFHGSLL